MDTRKLDRWADLLLDTGKRNNLVNFRDTRASTVEIVAPDVCTIFEKADGAAAFEVFDPKVAEEDFDELVGQDTATEDGSKKKYNRSEFISQYSPRIKRANQILAFSASVNPITAIRNIDKKAKEALNETGVNIAYMAFGFVHWKESESSSNVYRAPILLIPIQFHRENSASPYFIHTLDEDIVINPTLSYKLSAEHNFGLPDYADEGLSAYLAKVEAIVKKLKWSVSSECKIAVFSFQKINMYRDLKDNAGSILENGNVRALLGESREAFSGIGAGLSEQERCANPLIALHTVVDADSSQMEAIEMAKAGKSFVLQGPPGTGKSQTITNIIAECLSDGKKVLFVSEKMAALSVVFEKLKKAGLAEFCLELHSHKANKRAVIEELCHTLRMVRTTVSSKADAVIAEKEQQQKRLDRYADELHRRRDVIQKSMYQLYEAHAAYRHAPDVTWRIPSIETRDEAWLARAVDLLEQYVAYIPTIGYDYRKNPWYGYKIQDTSFQTKAAVRNDLQTVVTMLEEAKSLTAHLSEVCGTMCASIEELKLWSDFSHLNQDRGIATPALLQKKNIAENTKLFRTLQAYSSEIHALRAAIAEEYEAAVFDLNGTDLNQRLTKQFSGTFSRIFSKEHSAIAQSLRVCRKDGKKPKYQEEVRITGQLKTYQEKMQAFADEAEGATALLGKAFCGVETDWEHVLRQSDSLAQLFANGLDCQQLVNCSQEQLDAIQSALDEITRRFDQHISTSMLDAERLNACFDDRMFDAHQVSIEEAAQKYRTCIEHADTMDNWCQFRALLTRMDEMQLIPFIDQIINQNIESSKIIPAFSRAFYTQWITYVFACVPELQSFNRIGHDQAVAHFKAKDEQHLEISKSQIRARLSASRPSLDAMASGSAVSVLIREGEKKRKQKNIRLLMSEIGELIQVLKPCFLMSPLSVSTYLNSDHVHFDVVVFDEASQIFPQDAIGAVYRGKQLIVVGDSRQMPPSNFFASSIEGDNDEDEEVGDVTDFESILDLCSTAMPQLRLCWHYRSRYEQLIAFSNKNFYDNSLITFPSSCVDAQGIGVDYYHVDGTFDRKSHTNRAEAEFVVDLIYQNIKKYPDRSLGVVAFSVAQQSLIEHILDKRRLEYPENEDFFNDDNFFVKNLETVQGDERDTIIFSIAYGKDEQGRLLHNFGPLNRRGGERRLNVAATRAKSNVQLVSSMHAGDIDLKRTSAEGARLLREYLDFAENGEEALQRSITVGSDDQFDSDFELEVCEFLREKGYVVDTQVGCSGYRIDLGLKKPNSSDYLMAIECDGAAYHSSKNARDRDRLRQEILERMGWKFYRIWSTDWFKNQVIEKQRLLQAVSTAVSEMGTVVERVVEESEPVDASLSFEEVKREQEFEFPVYKMAVTSVRARRSRSCSYMQMVKEILEVEAPLSEEWLLKRTVSWFGAERVTSSVRDSYEANMYGCMREGIVRKNGFLYLAGRNEYELRLPSQDIQREIKYIAPEELAAGLYALIKQNVTIDKTSLYRFIAGKCGFSRVGKNILSLFDDALALLDSVVAIDGDTVSLK